MRRGRVRELKNSVDGFIAGAILSPCGVPKESCSPLPAPRSAPNTNSGPGGTVVVRQLSMKHRFYLKDSFLLRCKPGTAARERCLAWGFRILTTVLTLGCADEPKEPPKYPEGLLRTALAFRSKIPAHRWAEAWAVRAELPTCRFTVLTNSGIGRIGTFDRENPSYILREEDVLKLLGPPSSTNSQSYIYSVASGPTYRFNWFLEVEIYRGNVVRSELFSSDVPLQMSPLTNTPSTNRPDRVETIRPDQRARPAEGDRNAGR